MYGSILCLVEDVEGLCGPEKEAAMLSRLTGLRLVLLYVIEKVAEAEMVATDSAGWQAVYDDWRKEALALLERKEDLIREEGPISIKREIRGGNNAYEIISIATEQEVSMIVLLKSKAWVMGGLFASHLANKLLEFSPCPVLWVDD